MVKHIIKQNDTWLNENQMKKTPVCEIFDWVAGHWNWDILTGYYDLI